MRILIVATEPEWIGTARMPQALSRAGFEVGILCPPRSPVSHTKFASRRWLLGKTIRSLPEMRNAIRHVIADWHPARLFPGDDTATRVLLNMFATQTNAQDPSELRTLLLNSLGDPACHEEMTLKSALTKAAAACGIAMPPGLVSPGEDDAVAFARAHGFPLLLKPDLGAGGQGFRVCGTEEALRKHLAELAAATRVAFTLQKIIEGQPAGLVGVAIKGRLLAALAFAHRRKTRANGPTSVGERVHRPDMVEAAERLMGHFTYNGFAGVDFMIEERTGKAYLLEFNPRAAPMSACAHLMGVDLMGAYMAGLSDGEPPTVEPVTDTIALFPQEWMRDPESPFLRTAWLDVPWNDPQLLAYFTAAHAGKPPPIPTEILQMES